MGYYGHTFILRIVRLSVCVMKVFKEYTGKT